MSTSPPLLLRAMAWDPTRPAALRLPQPNGAVTTVLAGSGTGCHPPEWAALIQLMQAHELYHSSKETTTTTKHTQLLFRTYRAILSECIDAWPETKNTDDDDEESHDLLALELLKMNHAVLHLSSIFLPLLSSSTTSTSTTTTSPWHEDPYTVPGWTTADTIRYVRYHHLRDIRDQYHDDDDDDYEDILHATQPEHMPHYWSIVTQLVKQGALEDAWMVLSKQSLYQTAATAVSDHHDSMDREYVVTMRDIEQSFLMVRDLLLLAPVPGGRTTRYDNKDAVQDDVDETRMEDTVSAMVLDDLNVHPLDYQFWETTRSSTSSSGDVPVTFAADAAKRKHKIWQDYVKRVRQAATPWRRQVPELVSILDILAGDTCECDTWPEALVLELLYRQPDIRPVHVGSRARHIARQIMTTTVTPLEEALFHVMEGNAGEALNLLFEYGAGSGAALPSVLMALLCSLFVDSAILDESVSDRMIDFLCDAADAIRSSKTSTEQPDVGVQLSVRLLLPYALDPKQQQGGERIRSWIAEILEHYAPSTERYARAMVSLVRPLVEKKSLQLLDATSTMLLSLHRQCMETFDFQAAVLVLLDGIELEALVLPDRELGSCHRTLSLLCVDTTETILSMVFETTEEKVTLLADAKLVGEAVIGALVSRTDDVPEARLLARSMELVASLDKKERDEINDLILQILEGDQTTGGAILRTLHWHVLRIASHAIDHHATAAFDTKCIRVLMERFLQLTEYAELSKSSMFDQSTVASIETALANGLAKAFIAENARKATPLETGRETKFDNMNTSNLHHYSLDVQQRFVEELLDIM